VPSPLHRIVLPAAVAVLLVTLALLVAATRAEAVPPVVVDQPNWIVTTDFTDVEHCKDELSNTPPEYTLCTRETLTGDRGTWTDESSLSFTYEWLSCGRDGADCHVTSSFSGADPAAQPLLLGPDQLDRTVRFRVVATGPDGTTIATSERTNVITRGPVTRPVAQTMPSIDGEPTSGQVLNGRIGVWDDAFTDYRYDASWQRCGTDGLNCITISTQRMDGPNEPVQRVLTSADVGYTLRLAVTAHSIDRFEAKEITQVEYSPATPVIAAGASGRPVNVEPPQLFVGSYKTPAAPITGPVSPGDTLTASAGRWSVNDGLVVNWLRCARDGTGCVSILGADALLGQPARQSYIVASADLGSSIRADVTATAPGGTTTVRTNAARVGPDGTSSTGGGGTTTVKDRATVRVRSAKLTGSGNTLAVYLSLGAPGKVKVTGKGAGQTLGKASRELGKGKVAIAVKLSKSARKLLKKGRKVKMTLSLTLVTDAGSQGSMKQSVTLRGTSR